MPVKEMACILLDQGGQRQRARLLLDVVGNPLGKSGGAMIQQIATVFGVGSLAAATPVSLLSNCILCRSYLSPGLIFTASGP
jgi:ATP/ADP translocase